MVAPDISWYLIINNNPPGILNRMGHSLLSLQAKLFLSFQWMNIK